MSELTRRIEDELIADVQFLSELPPNEEAYSKAVENIKTLSDVLTDHKRIGIDAEANRIKEEGQKADWKRDILEFVLTGTLTIGVALATIYAEEVGGRVIRSKVWQFAGRILPKLR